MSNQAEALFQQGKSHFEQKKSDKAEQSFREAIKHDETNADYHAWLARALAAMEKDTLALDDANIALKLNPQCAMAYFVCGRVHGEKKEWDKAIQNYTYAIEFDSQLLIAYLNRGDVFYDKQEWDRAIQDYTRAIELDPQFVFAYKDRGSAFYNKQEWDRAIQDYTRAIELDPKDAETYNNRGNTFYDKREWDRAIQDYTRAIELDPKNNAAYNNRGIAFYDKQEWDKAIQDYTRAIELDPKEANAYTNRGKVFRYKEEWDKAIQDYTRAIELDPQYASTYYYRGLAFHHKQEQDKANQDYNRAVELDPKAKYPKYADRWLDWPESGWLSGKADITHVIAIVLGLMMCAIPGMILAIAMGNARSSYLKKEALIEENHNFAFKYTGCRWLGSVFHLGGHPALPFKQRVVLGIRSDSIRFYDYNLRLLHSVPLNEVQVAAETRHVTTSSFGTVYQPTNSSFGTVSSTQHVDMNPDTLRMALLVKGERAIAEFDMRPIDPLEFIHTFNKSKLG